MPSSSSPLQPVRIGIAIHYVKPCWRNLEAGGTCLYVSNEVEFILLMMRALKWNFTFVPTIEYGYPYPNDTSRWNGLVRKTLV